ncbi:MASE1 domain-containing protein [Maritimibacter sp. DP1N21-5]|uniref:MASE1 domain-containing protein n=1 Tax=Maritimibacter sp. DP1N21-5 TaxID=2836867 RepID=UPI001C4375DB|nr:MASE1 domain-containing protein [Maritimibacter sp. DP1N21-5]MBV7408218.1 MASE1 domain-containing protein [Maritimibacter sp. DP1N21-5]
MQYFSVALVVTLAYIIAHGFTALLITPFQSHFLPDITTFASLVYLPHGIRVLATWLFRWKAVPALFVGALLSEVLFTPGAASAVLTPVMLKSLLVGAASAFLAFEGMRLFGYPAYASSSRQIHWTHVLVAGVVSSLLNSAGQSIVFSTEILTSKALGVFAIYALGDIVGLVVTTLALMLVFRWVRLSNGRSVGGWHSRR